jgi:APA family basic amino acid/polyamine antiporter
MIEPAPDGLLRRQVGLLGATVSGTGVIIGAGVYALIGVGAERAGNAVWTAFLLAALVAGLSAVTYSRMGKRIPRDSAEFQYTGYGLGLRAGFLAGWLMLWADMIATAAVALAFGGYFSDLVGGPRVLVSIALVFLLAAVLAAGIHQSILVVSALTAAEVCGLLLVCAVGSPHWGDQPLLESNDGLSGVWAASSLVFFAYIGFDELGNLAEEMHQPERDLPRAILLAMVLSTTLYVLVAISAVSIVGAEVLAASPAPLADAVGQAMGRTGRDALSVLALAATSNTVLLLMLSGSRSLFGMSRSGALPAVLGKVNRRRTPSAGIILVVGVASGFILIGDIAVIAEMATFATLASFTLVNVSLMSVLKREARSWKAALLRPVSFLQPVLGGLACVWLAADLGPAAVAAGAIVGAVGLGIGVLIQTGRIASKERRPSWSRH